jgi:F0F1-type ATP synthase assembly protein I
LKQDGPVKKAGGQGQGWISGYNLALKFTIMLSCPILSGLACGIWLDKQLHTTPWLMFVLMIISLAFSIYAVYRVATREQ